MAFLFYLSSYYAHEKRYSVGGDYVVVFGRGCATVLTTHFGMALNQRPYPEVAVVPYPIVAMLFAIAPWVWTWRWHRDHRSTSFARCIRCHYNLTGNTSGVCPECGTAVVESAGVVG
jgi:hypothetical protein